MSFQVEMKASIWRYYKTKDFLKLVGAFDVITRYEKDIYTSFKGFNRIHVHS